MFETSFLLLLKYLVLNILIPFFPWLFFMWIFYGDKFRWLILYLLSWFVWVWVVAFSLLNIQFVHFWIWIFEYFVILWLLLFIFLWKLLFKKQKIWSYLQTLKIKNMISFIKKSFLGLTVTEKIFAVIISIYSLYFVFISWIASFSLPTYWIDAFWNRNDSAYNIYMDWWINLFWDESEILWRWRVWYPIQIWAYKALISKFVWWLNDIYFNMWQYLVFLFGLLFIFCITFEKTKDFFKSVLPIWLIISLPLVFFHSYEWYMDLPLIIYCVISAWLFYQYLESRDFDYLSLWFLFWFIASNIKNDWFVVFFPWLLLALFVVLCLNKNLKFTIKWFLKDNLNLWKSVWYFIYFLLPFLIVRLVGWLWFNQAGYVKSWIWFDDVIHWGMFRYFETIFLRMDNYNLILIMLFLVVLSIFTKRWRNSNDKLFILAWLVMFLILIAVFLFTVDYRYFENQTTVNRVFTMCFIMVLAFAGFIFDGKFMKKSV